jgi:hypothetical protein
MPIYINGEVVHIPPAQLIAEGKEIAAREGLRPKTQGVNLSLWAASIAVWRYSEAHRQWLEANKDEQTRAIENQAQENGPP